MVSPVRAPHGRVGSMNADSVAEDFVLTVDDVFTITGRGTVVTGRIESGVLRTGETVEIWDGGRLVATTRAAVEIICSRRAEPVNADLGSIALLFGDIDKKLLSGGQVIRKPAS